MSYKTKFQNGDTVRDAISGYEGVVTAVCIYATGCVQYEVKARGLDKDGLPMKNLWFDESRLAKVRAPKAKPQEQESPGGPQHHLS